MLYEVITKDVSAIFREFPEVVSSSVSVNVITSYSIHYTKLYEVDVGGLVIDRERYLISYKGVEMVLPKKEFELLMLLASKPDKVFTREEIYQTVWGHKIVVGDRTIDVHIRKLREKIGDDFIRTIKGVGYRFVNPDAE